jgi:hypothetical protein
VNSTGTTPATASGRQVGQVLAGRYRLAMSKGGDDIADVWHALDESTEKVVTLEILRDRDNDAARQRFLAEAQRMAAIERPSVMRVAAIHNEATDTFIVFEHLIPLPVVLTGLTGVATDGRPSAPQGPAPVTPSAVLSSVVGPKRAADHDELAVDDTAPMIVELDGGEAPAASSLANTAHLPESAQATSLSLGAARPNMSGLLEKLRPFGDDARLLVRDLGLETPVASARAFVSKHLDTSAIATLVTRVTTLVTRVTARAGELAQNTTTRARVATQATTKRAHVRPETAKGPAASGRAALSVARTATSVGAGVLSAVAAVASGALPVAKSLAASAAPHVARARGNPVMLAGATAAVFLVVFIVSPLDDMLTDAFRSGPGPAPTAIPSGGLASAPFEVPPLAAYGATFDSQGAYPRTTPGGTVEWVVALRNTGSAGWYRGIEGAQAALALPDGTGVAVQSTQYVAPGQVGWFVVRFRARSEVGTYTVPLLPRIDGRGPLPDLGIYAVVTVARNP